MTAATEVRYLARIKGLRRALSVIEARTQDPVVTAQLALALDEERSR